MQYWKIVGFALFLIWGGCIFYLAAVLLLLGGIR